jgi:hypothetical protein
VGACIARREGCLAVLTEEPTFSRHRWRACPWTLRFQRATGCSTSACLCSSSQRTASAHSDGSGTHQQETVQA